jgi:hypothetical protein
MKKYDGYDQAEAFTGDFEQITLGGHICKILKVTIEDKDYGQLMRIGFDIAEGEDKDFYKRQFNNAVKSNPDAKWRGMYYQTIKEDDLRFFKGFITVLENSNSGFKWDWDEKKLVGKLFGGVFGQEEYLNDKNEIKISTKCVFVRSTDQIRKGVPVPEIKRLKNTQSSNAPTSFYDNANTDDLPF